MPECAKAHPQQSRISILSGEDPGLSAFREGKGEERGRDWIWEGTQAYLPLGPFDLRKNLASGKKYKILCANVPKASASGDFVPQTPYRSFAP